MRSQLKRGYRFCSKRCWYKHNIGKNNPFFGKRLPFYTNRSDTKHTLETKLKISYSSTKNAKKGSESNFWRGGISDENNRLRHSKEWAFWRLKIFERDNYTCQNCKIPAGRITPHHICNFADYPNLRFSIDNGITLCEKCHKKFHIKYGQRENTRSQLDEFLSY